MRTIPAQRVAVAALVRLTRSCHGVTAFQGSASIFSKRRSTPLCASHSDAPNDDDDATTSSSLSRRKLLRDSLATVTCGAIAMIAPVLTPTAAAATSSSSSMLVPTPPRTPDVYWPLGKVAFSLLPLAGTSTRRVTVQETVVEKQIWTHDQIQGIVNVIVPVRQTVVKLSGGGLWVHNPLAPTPQLLDMMERLVQQHGPIKHIVLGTVALEHKATFGAFCSHFPEATVWIQPGQWSFPLDVPIEFYGLPQRGPRLREIPVPGKPVTQPQYAYYAEQSPVPEWTTDFEYEVLGPFKFQSVGGFSETAFYHKATKSLIVTDTVVSITDDPPAILHEDPRALLYHSRDQSSEEVQDTSETRRKGWRRMVQFGLVFFPSQIDVRTVREAFADVQDVPPDLFNLGEGAIPIDPRLYPWTWRGDKDRDNFRVISQGGQLFCPPILTKLILDRKPDATLEWVDRVSTRFKDMKRILPSHLNGNVPVKNSGEFYQAFDPLRSRPDRLIPQRALGEDLALLQKASDLLTKYGVVAPSKVCDGEAARKRGRFASRSS